MNHSELEATNTLVRESFEKVLRFERSDSSGPHRLEDLESKVEKMMKMMSQLLEAKSKGEGQQKEEEELGGTGRASGGRRPLLTQVMVLQQSEL